MQTEFNDPKLKFALEENSEQIKDPAGRPIRVLSESDADGLARQFHAPLHDVYAEALRAGIWPKRYMRNAAALSLEDQLKLSSSRVAVIGAGGLGGTALMLLARMGVGALVAVDADLFEESNLNRQLFARVETLGAAKVLAAKEAIGKTNPAVRVKIFETRFNESTAPDILSGADAALDALDNVADRIRLGKACQKAGIPLVHAAIAGFEGQIMTIYPGEAGLESVYGDEPGEPGPEASPEALMGVPAVTPSLLASLQVMETVKVLLGRKKQCLRGRMLSVDLEGMRFETLQLGDAKDQDY